MTEPDRILFLDDHNRTPYERRLLGRAFPEMVDAPLEKMSFQELRELLPQYRTIVVDPAEFLEYGLDMSMPGIASWDRPWEHPEASGLLLQVLSHPDRKVGLVEMRFMSTDLPQAGRCAVQEGVHYHATIPKPYDAHALVDMVAKLHGVPALTGEGVF